MNSEEKNRRAVKQYIALAIPPVGKAMGRVGRCVNAISSPERLIGRFNAEIFQLIRKQFVIADVMGLIRVSADCDTID